MKKCMVFRIEGRRPVGKPRRAWLDSVEADMAELEIDMKMSSKKWRRNVMKRVQPYRKTDYHHHVVSSSYLLPSLYACLSCIIEL